MTTAFIFINILLFLSITFIFLRYVVKSFVSDYFDNKPIIWIPERDRIIMALSIFSIVISLIFLKPDENFIVNISKAVMKIVLLFFLIFSILNRSKYFSYTEHTQEDNSKNIKTEQTNPKIDVSQDSSANTQAFELDFKSEEEVKRISEEYITNNMLDSEVQDVINMIQGTSTTPELNWIDNSTRSKQISFKSLFNFLVEICVTDISDLTKNDRKLFRKFIITNFLKGGEVIDDDSLNSSYSSWKNNLSS